MDRQREKPSDRPRIRESDLAVAFWRGDRANAGQLRDDWRTAVVNERLQGHVTLSEALTKLVAFHANVDVSQTIPTDAPLAATVVGGLAEVSYQSTRQLVFASGVRAWWQQQDPFGSFSSYMIYFDVTVSPPALRF